MKQIRPLANYDEILSPLENDVLRILWPSKALKVRDIYTELKPRRKVALTSVAVILDRLYGRNVVDRKAETGKGGIRYVYFPKQNKRQFEISVMDKAISSLIDKFGSTAVNYFNERFSKR